jgi:N-acetylneuraminate synthase
MASIKLSDSTILGDYGKPYIVAEVNTSHFGEIDLAKKMIDSARESGCDCVKFQSWSSGTLYSKTFYDENPIAKRFVDKFSFSEEELAEVADYSQENGVAFASTPYSPEEVDFLIERCNVPFIKIASMDLNNYPYLEHIGKTGTPIVLSTGMGDLEEIRRAVETIENTGNSNICLLHCISIYPPELSTIRLKNITGLKMEFPEYPIGFSDHSEGIEMASAAIALGACLIEKHLTLDKNKIGMDNQMATEPEEMSLLVKNCHNVQNALGGEERIVQDAELEQRERIRRSIVFTKNMKAGEKITFEDLDAKRPGTGIPPEKMYELVGKSVSRDVECDTIILPGDIE